MSPTHVPCASAKITGLVLVRDGVTDRKIGRDLPALRGLPGSCVAITSPVLRALAPRRRTLELPGCQRLSQRLTVDPAGHGDAATIHVGHGRASC